MRQQHEKMQEKEAQISKLRQRVDLLAQPKFRLEAEKHAKTCEKLT